MAFKAILLMLAGSAITLGAPLGRLSREVLSFQTSFNDESSPESQFLLKTASLFHIAQYQTIFDSVSFCEALEAEQVFVLKDDLKQYTFEQLKKVHDLSEALIQQLRQNYSKENELEAIESLKNTFASAKQNVNDRIKAESEAESYGAKAMEFIKKSKDKIQQVLG